MNSESLLQHYRRKYQPPLPPLLRDLNILVPIKHGIDISKIDPEMQKIFPHLMKQPIILYEKGTASFTKPLKVGVVFSGGQASGGHNVIVGLWNALTQMNPSSTLIGFLDGPSGLIKNKFEHLDEKKIALYQNQGGFDLIGSGRTKIETPDQFEAVKQTLLKHQLDGLVIIGGDDSNTNAAFLAEYCIQNGIQTRIVGVPKTIDGDLKNAYIEISFGFDTASKVYSEIIGNLLKDALSAKKYYFFVKLMGRSASHLTLECALQTQPNLALIGEEIFSRKQTLTDVVNHVADLICARADEGKNYGVILIPEGMLEFIPDCREMIKELNTLLTNPSLVKQLEEADKAQKLNILKKHLSPKSIDFFSALPEQIQKQLLLDRDPHGNIQLSKIETERLIISLVEQELIRREQKGKYKGKFNPQPLFFGYEGRSGFPTNFDSQYCYALGYGAALLIRDGASGSMCCIKNLSGPVENWQAIGVPIVKMLHFELRKNKNQAVIQKAWVDLDAPPFKLFQKQRDHWRTEDHYLCPGPIQFEGTQEITDKRPLILLLEKKEKTTQERPKN